MRLPRPAGAPTTGRARRQRGAQSTRARSFVPVPAWTQRLSTRRSVRASWRLWARELRQRRGGGEPRFRRAHETVVAGERRCPNQVRGVAASSPAGVTTLRSSTGSARSGRSCLAGRSATSMARPSCSSCWPMARTRRGPCSPMTVDRRGSGNRECRALDAVDRRGQPPCVLRSAQTSSAKSRRATCGAVSRTFPGAARPDRASRWRHRRYAAIVASTARQGPKQMSTSAGARLGAGR
jgi:hypothetical protein